jgi:hypothetical protein
MVLKCSIPLVKRIPWEYLLPTSSILNSLGRVIHPLRSGSVLVSPSMFPFLPESLFKGSEGTITCWILLPNGETKEGRGLRCLKREGGALCKRNSAPLLSSFRSHQGSHCLFRLSTSSFSPQPRLLFRRAFLPRQ